MIDLLQHSDDCNLNFTEPACTNQRILDMPQNKTWYFSYGSNLSKQQMLRRTGSIPMSRLVSLANFRLAFRKVLSSEDVYATIVPMPGGLVHGVVYSCSPHAMSQLDLVEGVAENCYRRELVEVTTHDGDVLSCIVYIGEAFSVEESVPSSNYLDLILTGAKEHQLPVDYIKSITTQARCGTTDVTV